MVSARETARGAIRSGERGGNIEDPAMDVQLGTPGEEGKGGTLEHQRHSQKRFLKEKKPQLGVCCGSRLVKGVERGVGLDWRMDFGEFARWIAKGAPKKQEGNGVPLCRKVERDKSGKLEIEVNDPRGEAACNVLEGSYGWR